MILLKSLCILSLTKKRTVYQRLHKQTEWVELRKKIANVSAEIMQPFLKVQQVVRLGNIAWDL